MENEDLDEQQYSFFQDFFHGLKLNDIEKQDHLRRVCRSSILSAPAMAIRKSRIQKEKKGAIEWRESLPTAKQGTSIEGEEEEEEEHWNSSTPQKTTEKANEKQEKVRPIVHNNALYHGGGSRPIKSLVSRWKKRRKCTRQSNT